MKLMTFCTVILLVVSGSAWAQAPARKSQAVPDPKAGRAETRAIARTVAVEARVPLTEDELAVANRVHVGTMPCELGQVVVLAPESGAPGYFSLRLGRTSYRVSPESTTTGAIRLEDKVAGIVWLQLANKSMLMSQKLGRRLADECRSPAQDQTAQAMLVSPPLSILEPLPMSEAPTPTPTPTLAPTLATD